jgi:hypothetical protein
MIEITIDTHGLLDGLAKIPIELKKALRVEMKDQLTQVQREARVTHRHSNLSVKRRYRLTGNLNRSVTVAIDPSGLIGEVGLDLQKAYYGPYVHEGHHGWAPDRFLDAALLKQEPKLRIGLENALRAGLQAAGAI